MFRNSEFVQYTCQELTFLCLRAEDITCKTWKAFWHAWECSQSLSDKPFRISFTDLTEVRVNRNLFVLVSAGIDRSPCFRMLFGMHFGKHSKSFLVARRCVLKVCVLHFAQTHTLPHLEHLASQLYVSTTSLISRTRRSVIFCMGYSSYEHLCLRNHCYATSRCNLPL